MSLFGKAFELLQKYGDVVGVDWFKGPSLLDKMPNLGVLNLAGSPILAAAQVTIKGMKQTTGSGEPEAGADFETSAKKYTEAGDLTFGAAPQNDRWNGTAADTYKTKNQEQSASTFGVARAESEMRTALGELATQVATTRKDLDDRIQFLADVDSATAWMNAVPGGAVVKAAADLATATSVLALATGDLAILTAESVTKAGQIRETLEAYNRAAAQKLVGTRTHLDQNLDGIDDGEVPCNEPFGNERESETLPDRTNPESPFTMPKPDGPPADYPPATPYNEAPR